MLHLLIYSAMSVSMPGQFDVILLVNFISLKGTY